MKPSSKQLTEYKDNATRWAQERLADEKTVILDLETTGLLSKDPETEIAQICLLNTHGRPILSMLLKPSQPMSEEVIGIHKITNEQVVDQPIFPQVAKVISYLLEGKHVIAYNMDFDWKLLMHMFKKYKEAPPKVAGASCCMDHYSEWVGEWNTRKDGFKWHRLPNLTGEESHDAIADCRNTLKLMQKMAGMFDESKVSAEDLDLDF